MKTCGYLIDIFIMSTKSKCLGKHKSARVTSCKLAYLGLKLNTDQINPCYPSHWCLATLLIPRAFQYCRLPYHSGCIFHIFHILLISLLFCYLFQFLNGNSLRLSCTKMNDYTVLISALLLPHIKQIIRLKTFK